MDIKKQEKAESITMKIIISKYDTIKQLIAKFPRPRYITKTTIMIKLKAYYNEDKDKASNKEQHHTSISLFKQM